MESLNNNNKGGVAMRPYDKITSAPGFQEFQQILEVNGVYLDDRTVSFADRKDTYIVVGSYITIFDKKDYVDVFQTITLNILFAVGEQALVWTTVQWWMDEGKFIAPNGELGLTWWANSFGYEAKLYREVINAFKAWFTEGASGGNILFDPEFGENLNCTNGTDVVKWFKWIPDDVENFLQNQYEEEE
jgi:hypothetical protein